MKKVLVLVPDLKGVGGVSNYYKVLRLDQLTNIKYFTVNSSEVANFVKTIARISINYLCFFYLLMFRRFQIVHLNPSFDKKSFLRDTVFFLISRVFAVKRIVFFRGWDNLFEEKIRKNSFYRVLFKAGFAKSDVIIVLGSIFKKKLLELGVEDNGQFIIETTVADDSYLGELDLREKQRTFEKEAAILFLSRIVKEKGIYLVIDSFANLNKKNAKLIIAGIGPELASVKNYISERRIPNVSVLGLVEGEKKKHLLLTSHIMFFPTCFGEGLPNSLLEGMLYGMPVITRNIGGIPDVVSDRNGLVSSSTDPVIFSNYLGNLLDDFQLYQSVSSYNHQYALQRFTGEKVRQRLLALYNN